MRTSKITAITPNGTQDTDYGMLYKFEYAFEDGTVITARHKQENSPFNIGDTAEYEIKGDHPTHGLWGKVKKPQNDYQGNPITGSMRPKDFETGIVVGHAINNGTQLAIAHKGSAVTIQDVEQWSNLVRDLAHKMKSQ